MPEKTLEAVADHGEIAGDTGHRQLRRRQQVLDDLEPPRHRLRRRRRRRSSARASRSSRSPGTSCSTTSRRSSPRPRRRLGRRGRQVTHVALGVVAAGAGRGRDRARTCPALVDDRFASRLFAQDATLWGPDAEAEAAIRLSWVGLARVLAAAGRRGRGAARASSREQGVDHVVLCGMGGSSLAPEVICATAGVELTVLDSTDPDQVRAALADRLERTVVVVSSKSGSTVETDTQRRAYEQAFTDAGIDPAARIVVVTDPGSPLDEQSRAAGYRVVNADPDVGGRYSALTAFGLVPERPGRRRHRGAARRGRGGRRPARRGRRGQPRRCGSAPRWPAPTPLRDKLVLVDDGSGIVGFADWAEQLIAESTGKQGTGHPARRRRATTDAPEVALARRRRHGRPPRRRRRRARRAAAPTTATQPAPRSRVSGPLGAQMLLWEVATAVAGRLLGHQPVRPARRGERQEGRPRRCSTGSPDSAPSPPSPTAPSRSARSAATGSATPRTVADGGRRAARRSSTRARLRRGDGLPRPARRRRPRRRARAAGARVPSGRRRSAGARGSCTPPASSTRAARPTASTCRSPPTPHEDLAVPGRDVHLRRLHRRPGRRRRAGARRPRPAGAAAAPHRPRRGLAQLAAVLRRRRPSEGACMSPARVAHGTNPLRDPQRQAPPPHRRPVRPGASSASPATWPARS